MRHQTPKAQSRQRSDDLIWCSGHKLGQNLPMTVFAPYPHGRPRRLRRDAFTRNLVRENTLTATT